MKQNIQDLFNYHFEYGTRDKDNTVNSIIIVKGLQSQATKEQKDLANFFRAIKKRYGTSLEFYNTEDMVQEFAHLFLDGATKLEQLESLDYLLDNPTIYKERINYIFSNITNEFKYIANPQSETIVTDTGKKHIDIQMSSIDVIVSNEEGETELSNLLGQDTNLFSAKDSHHNHFIQWVLDNRETILTARQLEVFNYLMVNYIPLTDRKEDTLSKRQEMLKEIGLTSNSLNSSFKAIKKKCMKAYEKEFQGIYHGHSHNGRMNLHDMLNSYVEFADSNKWIDQEERRNTLTHDIASHFDYEDYELIINKGLTSKQKQEIVKGINDKDKEHYPRKISHKVLRLINNNIKAYLKENEDNVIEASFPEYGYKENPLAGLAIVPSNNLSMTATGLITYKDKEGNEKLA